MRNLRMVWKDYKITIFWLKDEINRDITDIFHSVLSPNTYGNFLTDYIQALKNVFTSPTNGVYWAVTLFIFSWVYSSLLWMIFFGFMILFAYIHRIYKSGEPLRDYKKKYFPWNFRREIDKSKKFIYKYKYK